MKVGQRLFLAVLPAILGVFTVVGLAYWGQYTHQAPRLLVVVAIAAAIVSLGMAWYNTRYVARRVERLVVRTTGRGSSSRHTPFFQDFARAVTGGVVSTSSDPDELDTIESTVSDLNSAVRRARDDGERRVRDAEAREAEYAATIDEVAHLMAVRLEEAELPLHVLLSSPFGVLNENQEEMLTAAQSAIDAANLEVRRLRTLLALDRGALTPVRKPASLTELLKPALAIAQARGRSGHVTVHVDVSAVIPRVIVDPMQVQAALTTIFSDAVSQTPIGSEISITAGEGDAGQVQLYVRHGGTRNPDSEPSLDLRLARRFLVLQHGTLSHVTGQIVVELPSEALTRVIHRDSTDGLS